MNRCLRMVVVGVALWLVGTVESRGAIIAYWHFNDSDTNVDQGAGELSTNFPSADVRYLSGSSTNTLAGVPAGNALVMDDQINNGRHLDFRVSTANYKGIGVSLVSQRTSTGFNANQLAYSVDGGGTFQAFGAPFAPGSSFSLFSADLSSIASLDKNANAVFRIIFQGATSATGNNRLDNIQFTGTFDPGAASPVPASLPEPHTGLSWVLIGSTVALGARLSRRWNAAKGN